jgi:mannosyltransferase
MVAGFGAVEGGPAIMRINRTLPLTDAVALAILIAVGTLLRLYRLDTGLWLDEIISLLDSIRPPLTRILTHFPSNNDHPLYSVLAHLSVDLFGEGAFALRLPAALFGVAAIPLLYFVGRAIADRGEALAAATVLTVSYHHVWFSQNARGYTALLFCVLLATYMLTRWLDTGRRLFLVGYAVVTAFGAYAHLTMVLVSVSHALALAVAWLAEPRESRIRRESLTLASAFGGAALLSVTFYAPMFADVNLFFSTQTATATEVATPVWATLAAVRGLQVGFGAAWGIAVGGVVFGLGLWSHWQSRRAVALLIALPVPVTLLLALALDRPIFPRFVFFAFGFALLIAMRGASVAGRLVATLAGGRVAAFAGSTAVLGLFTLAAVAVSVRSLPHNYRLPKQDYEQAVAFVERTKLTTDIPVVVGEPAATPVQRYLGRPWPRVYSGPELRRLREEGAPVWVVYTFPSYIEANDPELWTMLQEECSEAGIFEGTVEGGTISVRYCR